MIQFTKKLKYALSFFSTVLFFLIASSFYSDDAKEWNPSLSLNKEEESEQYSEEYKPPHSEESSPTAKSEEQPSIEQEYNLKPKTRKPTLEEEYHLLSEKMNGALENNNQLLRKPDNSLKENYYPLENSDYFDSSIHTDTNVPSANDQGKNQIPAQALGPLTPQPSPNPTAPPQTFFAPPVRANSPETLPARGEAGTIDQDSAQQQNNLTIQQLDSSPALANEPTNRTILINFNNVSIIEFIRFISRISNKNFIFNDLDLDFNVTIVSEEAATIENVMAVLMQVLRVHGLSLMEQGNNIMIHRNKAVNAISQVVADGLPLPLQMHELITQVFRLNTLDAEKAAELVQPLISEGALVEVLPGSNHLIVTDITTNIGKIGQLLRSLDAPISGMVIGQYVVVNARVDSLISLAERVMEPIADGKPLVFVAHNPSRSIFIVSTPFLVDRSLAILRNLDVNVGVTRIFSGENLRFAGQGKGEGETEGEKEGEGAEASTQAGQGDIESELDEQIRQAGGVIRGPLPTGTLENRSSWNADLPEGHIERIKFYIHKLRYRKGEQIMDALQRVGISLQETGTGNLDLIATIQSIQWIESSNSLVFTGTIDAVAKVKELIEEIDTPLRQVFIEMLIMETTLDDSLNYSVNWGSRFNNRGDVAGSQSFISEVSTLNNALDSAAPGSTIDVAGLARQAGYHLGIVGRNITHGGLSFDTIGALVTAFHQKDKVEILMNPKLLVEDNATAEVFVGVNTAFQISSIANDRGEIITNNFEFRDVGTLLRVTPLISNNDVITLEIREEVSSIASQTQSTGALSSQTPGPTTRINRTITKVHVPNKYFLVMSGMIQDENERIRTQVPCLGGVPVIGAAFGGKSATERKRNLMIFIRPQIIDTAEDIDNITRHEQDIFRNKARSKKMWKYEVEEALDFLNIKCPEVSLHDSEIRNP
ncbi:putative component D of type II secretion pathway [Chlamydiales bacterium STE3]|nr:putative component D of type II secretion pathway [Chlamydiales bacterium STE3]